MQCKQDKFTAEDSINISFSEMNTSLLQRTSSTHHSASLHTLSPSLVDAMMVVDITSMDISGVSVDVI